MNEYLLTKLKQLSNSTVKNLRPSVKEITVSVMPIRRTRRSRKQSEISKRQSLKDQLKEL